MLVWILVSSMQFSLSLKIIGTHSGICLILSYVSIQVTLNLCCCRQPSYGIHERKTMDKHIYILETNDWICDCEGPWGSLILQALKPHQEGCTDINDFLWRLCVSYRPLNSVTRSFEFPIPRYAGSIEDFGDFNGRIYFISLDARSGYHQTRVRQQDQGKLVFSHLVGKRKPSR